MDLSAPQTSILLLAITFLTITEGQYYDFFQGFQQVLQPYPQQRDFFSPFNNYNIPVTHRYETKKKTDNQDRRIKKPPTHQFDYIFATTTTVKPSRKPSKSNSSRISSNKPSNKNYNGDIIFSDNFNPSFEVTTKRNRVTAKPKVTPNDRVTTSTIKPINSYYNSRPTTERIYSTNLNNKDTNNLNRPVTEYVANNDKIVYVDNNYESRRVTPSNPRNPNVQNININNSKNINDNLDRPTNHRNPNVAAINNQNRVTQNHRNIYSTTTSRYHNNYDPVNNYQPHRDVYNYNNGNSFNKNHGNLNTDYDVNNNFYPENPVIIRPGVKPVIIDVNQPPITNKPATDDKNIFVPFDRPSSTGFDNNNSERPVDKPEIIIGPDEDDMSERQKRSYINIAERMCERYKSLNVKEVAALPLLPSPEPVEFNVTSCVPITAPLVIGGKVVSINEFPHMALVGWRKIRSSGYSWKCGASLVSDRYLLTAGHCTYQDKDYDVESGPPQAVQLGSSYHDDPDAQVVRISAVIRHPKYKQRRSYYDLALIRMAHTVRFSDAVRPACLGGVPPVGDNIIATGWGRTEFGGDHSEELRSVSLKVWNMPDCREIWGTSLKLPNGPSADSHMCAGEKRGGKDTCQGDSGGPAQIQDGCVWRIVAVTSVGRSCGAPNTPALYSVLKVPFISAEVFGSEQEGFDRRKEDRTRNQDGRTPSYINTQQGFSLRPTYVVNNFRRE